MIRVLFRRVLYKIFVKDLNDKFLDYIFILVKEKNVEVE